MSIFTQQNHVIAGIYPVANAFAGTVYSDIYNMKNANHITFFVMKGAGTGTATLTVEACSTVGAAAVTAIPYKYKLCVSATTEDTFGALTAALAAGFNTNAAANEMYAIEVDAADVIATGYSFVRLKSVEVSAVATVGCVFAILSELRDKGEVLPEAIS